MQIGVIGAGTMGRGIAQVASLAGDDVFLVDLQEDVLRDAREYLDAMFNKMAAKGRITQAEADAALGRIHSTQKLSVLTDANLVVEAIVENTDAKRSAFRALEEQVSKDCLLASNTSSLSIASIAAACENPGRVLGLHFFNPPALMRLVEIVPALQTDRTSLDRAKDIIVRWGKTGVVAKDTPGFIVNRIARPFYGEALRILEEGIADAATIDWAMTEIGGFRMGPFSLMDYIGNDVNYAVTKTVFQAFYYDPKYKPAFTQKNLVDAGWLGRKSGRGYYDYSEGSEKPKPIENKLLGQQIFRRILVMLINEAADALFWGIASKEDIELAMTLGVNYPKGLLQWADEIGIGLCVQELDLLYDYYREDRYRCSTMLRRKASDMSGFFAEHAS